MNSGYIDIDAFGSQVKEKELIAIIQNRKEDQGRQLAFKTLVQRKSKKMQKLSIEVLNNPLYDRRMKLIAANFLGKNTSKDGIKSLCKELRNAENKQLKSRVLRSIGEIGDLATIMEIEGIKSRDASFARSLIAYRHGIKGYALPTAKTKSFSKRSKHTEMSSITITPARENELNKMIETQLDILGEFRIPKLKLNCAGNDLYLMQSDKITNKHLSIKLLLGPSIPMKVFSVGDCPRRVVLSYYVMTTPIPGKENEINVQLITPSGRKAYYGEVSVNGKELNFSLGTVEDSIFPATQINGNFNINKDEFDFTSLLSNIKLDDKKRRIPKRII
ncbi:hypothetical protein SAMN04487910_0576 [Aquimarina amphilecti]|uniref:HEAT repeat-containing protein n=1 Tax=Aquimarina amphilecti TaxID=1038014 RepID=A0A1H7H852_AQUAM|nr:hypothetical protein [Aquimarina amphilecti]SEK45957.1 hypothetical protein SAMN04487910_0576 [Aquimarina amphilecti]